MIIQTTRQYISRFVWSMNLTFNLGKQEKILKKFMRTKRGRRMARVDKDSPVKKATQYNSDLSSDLYMTITDLSE